MPKFEVTALQQIKYLIEVEAETPEEAEAVAKEIWARSEHPTSEFESENYGVEITHVCRDGVPE
jgi:hypothetical protein